VGRIKELLVMTRTIARIAAVIVAVTVGVLMLSPTYAGATCGHAGQPQWCPALPTSTTTAAPTTTTSTVASTTTTTMPSPTTIGAVLGDADEVGVSDAVVTDIGEAIHIERSPAAKPVRTTPHFAG
jgi:hypothetical protein